MQRARRTGLILAALLLMAIACIAPTGPGYAQQAAPDAAAAPPNFALWELDARRSEAALEANRVSNLAFEQLRSRIVGWRAKFTTAQTVNVARIATLKGQITALGPAPVDGATEAPEIGSRRSDLNEQLTRLEAPTIAAVEAYSRADGIIREIDATIRARQADALLKLSPSPANPANWAAGAAVLSQGLRSLWAELVEAWANPASRKELRDNLPAVLLYPVIAGFLLLRGPGYFHRFAGRVRIGGSRPARRLAAGVVSLGQVALPVGGVYLLIQAAEATGMTGIKSGALLAAVPGAALAFFAARWMGNILFPAEGESGPGAEASRAIIPGRASEAQFLASVIGLVVAAQLMRIAFITEVRPPLSMAAQSVWAAPLPVLAAIFLFRFGQLLRRDEGTADAAEALRFRVRMRRLVGLALVAVGVFGPLLAVVGYTAAASALVWPMVNSMALVGLLILLQWVVSDLFGMVTRSDAATAEGLAPVLIGFVLIVAALPIFALIWGARVADLLEIWTGFLEGVAVGETRISPTVFLTFAGLFAAGFMVTRLVQGALRSSVLPKTRIDKGGQNAIVSGTGYLGIFIAAIIAITAAGIDLSSLAIVAGALSVGIGFGLQNIVSNFVSGIILLVERPISEGDWIEVGGKMGIVKSISVRSTRIETFDRTEVIIPNADLVSGVVTNWTRGNMNGRLIVPVGVAYGTDTHKVEHILRDIAEAHPLVVMNPPPMVALVGFGADALNFEIRVIVRDVHFLLVTQSEINHEIARRFGEEGIEIPFPQRDVWIRNAVRLEKGGLKSRQDETRAAQAARDAERAPGGLDDTRREPRRPPSDAGSGE